MAVANVLKRTAGSHRLNANSAVGIAIVSSYGFAVPAILGIGDSSAQIGSAIASVAVASATALAVYRRHTGHKWLDLWLTPPGLLWLMVVATFCIATLQWLPPTSTSAFFQREFVGQALVAVSAMTWASLLGYVSLTQQLQKSKLFDRFEGLQERFSGAGLVAYSIGAVATAILLMMNRYSFIGDPVAALSETSSLTNALTLLTAGMTYGAVLVLWNGLSLSSPRYVRLGYGMFASIAVLGVVSGFKGPVITAGLAVVAILRLAYGRYPRMLLAGIVVGVVVLFPLNTAYRAAVRDSEVPPSRALPVAVSTAVAVSMNDPIGVLVDTSERIISRLRLVDSTAVIVARTPTQVPYASALEIPIDVTAGMVPRTLWPEKPISDSGYVFGQEYLGLDPGAFTSIAITLPGSFYRYGGLIAVVVGGLALGGYLVLLDRIANPLVAPAGIILFLALVQPLSSLESALVPLVLSQVQNGAVALLTLFAIVKQRSQDVFVDEIEMLPR